MHKFIRNFIILTVTLLPAPGFSVIGGEMDCNNQFSNVFSVSSFSRPNEKCSSVLIGEKLVLTAFHCVLFKKASELLIQASSGCNGATGQSYAVEKVQVIKGMNRIYTEISNLHLINRDSKVESRFLEYSALNDLALITLKEKPDILPVPIFSREILDNLYEFEAVQVGFGIYSKPFSKWDSVQTGIRHFDRFGVTYTDNGYFEVSQSSKSSPAKGDSGGPLIHQGHLVGVLSGNGSGQGLFSMILKNFYILKSTGWVIPFSKEDLDREWIEHSPAPRPRDAEATDVPREI